MSHDEGEDIQLVSFRLGRHEFAVDILELQRVLRYDAPAPLPDAPDFLDGVVAYEGGAVPVVDLRKRLSLPAEQTEETRIMVLELGSERVGIVVDQAREVLRVDSGAIVAPPAMVKGLAAQYISGILPRGERTLVILNAQRLLTSKERLALRELEATA